MSRKILFLFLLLSGFSAFGQKQDFRSWIDLELEGELFNLIDFSITPELRLANNSSQVDAILGEVDLSVPATKFLRFGIEYRNKMEFMNDDRIVNSNRFGIYAELDERVADFRMAYRIMYLQEYSEIFTSENGWVPESLHRHKISLKYRQKGWNITPGLAAEGFFMINPIWDRNEYKWRFTAGAQYRLTKKINLGLSYKLQKEYNQNNPLTAHILNLGLEYEL